MKKSKLKQQINFKSRVPVAIQALKIRRSQNRDSIVVVTGEKRSGKSYGAIKLCEKLDPDFDVDKQVFFDIKPFLLFMRDKTNSVCVLDEVSVNYSNRTWWELQNKIFNTVLTTQGFRGNTIFMTLPVLSHLDKRNIELAHYIYTTVKLPYMVCYRLKTSQFSKKMFPMKFEILRMELPTNKSVRKYEAMKKKWNDAKLKDDISYIEMVENPETYKKMFEPKHYFNSYKEGIMTKDQVIAKLKGTYSVDDIKMVLSSMDSQAKRRKEKQLSIHRI